MQRALVGRVAAVPLVLDDVGLFQSSLQPAEQATPGVDVVLARFGLSGSSKPVEQSQVALPMHPNLGFARVVAGEKHRHPLAIASHAPLRPQIRRELAAQRVPELGVAHANLGGDQFAGAGKVAASRRVVSDQGERGPLDHIPSSDAWRRDQRQHVPEQLGVLLQQLRVSRSSADQLQGVRLSTQRIEARQCVQSVAPEVESVPFEATKQRQHRRAGRTIAHICQRAGGVDVCCVAVGAATRAARFREWVGIARDVTQVLQLAS